MTYHAETMFLADVTGFSRTTTAPYSTRYSATNWSKAFHDSTDHRPTLLQVHRSMLDRCVPARLQPQEQWVLKSQSPHYAVESAADKVSALCIFSWPSEEQPQFDRTSPPGWVAFT